MHGSNVLVVFKGKRRKIKYFTDPTKQVYSALTKKAKGKLEGERNNVILKRRESKLV